jgi:hypothetical protein
MSLISALRLFAKTARVVLVLTLMVALCAAGADAARRVDAESKKVVKEAVRPTADVAQVGPAPVPEMPGGNMAPNSRPTTEQQAVLSAVTAPAGGDRSNEQADQHLLPLSETPHLNGSACGGAAPVASLALVTPRAAQLHTLVGAVPSGTM